MMVAKRLRDLASGKIGGEIPAFEYSIAADEIEKLHCAFENCRLFAARNRKESWALLILGFLAEAGVVGSVTRREETK